MSDFKKKYVGDREFYSRMFGVMIPVLLQNVITNFVSLLDNIMVGIVGTEQMSGVAIVNELMFVFNICIFGATAGAGIFTAQYFGKGDEEGIKNTMRAKAWAVLGTLALFGTVFIAFGDNLMMAFIHEGEDSIDLEQTLLYGRQYLNIIFLQMPLFAAINVYASSLRETSCTKLPFEASLVSVAVNLTFNWILIYGKLGTPALGVRGAAYATVLARIVELVILVRASSERFKDVWKTLRFPLKLARDIAKKTLPLLINELLWSGGMVFLVQILSLKGIEIVSAENISNTVSNLFFCAFFAMGSTISIIVGQHLGAERFEQAVDEDRKLTAFTLSLCTVVGIVMAAAAPFIPKIYNTTPTVKRLATAFILVNAGMMPFNSYTNACYFTLRSGGKVFITFIYDAVFAWAVSIPVTLFLVKCTSLSIISIYIISYGTDILKSVIGFFMVRKKGWVRNIVNDL